MKIPKDKEYLFFKNGKPKKSYFRCESKQKRAELQRLRSIYNIPFPQCAGLECPFYELGCGKSLLEKFEKENKK